MENGESEDNLTVLPSYGLTSWHFVKIKIEAGKVMKKVTKN